jgi:flagellar biosynthetic protein FliQ
VSNQEVVIIIKEAVTVILTVSSPMLLGALIIGFIVSLFQATTQINEPTMAFVPKIVVVFLSLLIFGSWILEVMHGFTLGLYEDILRFII